MFSLLIDVGKTFYGGVRFKIAAVFSKGWGGSYTKEVAPYNSYKNIMDLQKVGDFTNVIQGTETITNHDLVKNATKYQNSEIVGGYITFSIYFGVYFDYGWIHASSRTGESEVETDTFYCFMGAGGFAGAKLTAGYSGLVPLLPFIYYNVEAKGSVTAYFGENADPAKTLEAFENTRHHDVGADFSFQWEVRGRVSV